MTQGSMVRDLFQTTKPRILLLVLLSTYVGFFLAAKNFSAILLFHTLVGTGLVCASCNSLNQLLERDTDSRMRRTQNRPLPAGRLRPGDVLIFGCALGIAGLAYLFVVINFLTALLGAIALGSYLFVYTPLKKRTPLCTLIGAVPGAAPVLMGWTAGCNALNLEGWILFVIVFLWQLPHFFAIATMYREDYAAAGLPMLPVQDMPCANRQIVLYSLGLLLVSLLPTTLGIAGLWYFCGALILGGFFAGMGICLMMNIGGVTSRAVFFSSIVYLPLLFALLVMDKL